MQFKSIIIVWSYILFPVGETGDNVDTFDLKNRNSAETQHIALNFMHFIVVPVPYAYKNSKAEIRKSF